MRHLVRLRVRELITRGMRPIGGIAMLYEEQAGRDKLYMIFAQAMVRDGAGAH